ncbi:hypothetical protein [Streptomyces flavofungini]|nr:hypothetical protein [Streptomyces flavofungini]WJV47143.1 hypothetical protein QUY26_17420 [Streptomyces flavofungini]
MPHSRLDRPERRARTKLAITGLAAILSGATRAVIGWLLDHEL